MRKVWATGMTTVLRILFFTFLGWVIILTMIVANHAHATAPTIEQSIALGRQAWPQLHCENINIVWWTDAQADAQLWAGPYGADGASRADVPCVIALRRSLMVTDPYHLCDDTVHEMGHQAGMGHVDNTVMDGNGHVYYPPCHLGEITYARTRAVKTTTHHRVRCGISHHRRTYRSRGKCYLVIGFDAKA